MTQGLLWIADPRLIKMVMKDDDPVGFLIAYPDVSAALQRNKARLFPFGWLDILMETRKTKWININGAGIVAKYRRMGAMQQPCSLLKCLRVFPWGIKEMATVSRLAQTTQGCILN